MYADDWSEPKTGAYVTWTFDDSYCCGQYVTGDWWVVGPVNITGITPTPTKAVSISPGNHGRPIEWDTRDGQPGRNGTMRNMRGVYTGLGYGNSIALQGFDCRNLNGYYHPDDTAYKNSVTYHADLCWVPPFTLNPGDQIVSCASGYDGKVDGVTSYNTYGELDDGTAGRRLTWLDDMAVLTVVETPPPATAFRPPVARPDYGMTNGRVDSWEDDPLQFFTTDADISRIYVAEVGDISGAQSIDSTIQTHILRGTMHRFWPPTPCWYNGTVWPKNNYSRYGREYGNWIHEAMSRVIYEDPAGDPNGWQLQCFYKIVQVGIDLYGAYLDGGVWRAQAQQTDHRKLPLLFAGKALNHSGMLGIGAPLTSAATNAKFKFGEDGHFYDLDDAYDAGRITNWFTNLTMPWGGWRATSADPYIYDIKGDTSGQVGRLNTPSVPSRVIWFQTDDTLDTQITSSDPESKKFYNCHEHLPPSLMGLTDEDRSQRGFAYMHQSATFIVEAIIARAMGFRSTWGHDAFFKFCERWMDDENDDAYKAALNARGYATEDYWFWQAGRSGSVMWNALWDSEIGA